MPDEVLWLLRRAADHGLELACDFGGLAAIAARSGGQTFSAASAVDLESIFAHIVAIVTCAAPSLSTALDVAPGTT
jgi:hypothetical protein